MINKRYAKHCIKCNNHSMAKSELIYLQRFADKSKTYLHHPPRLFFGRKNEGSYTPDFYCIEDHLYIEIAGSRQSYCANKGRYEAIFSWNPKIKFVIIKIYDKTIERFIRGKLKKHSKLSPEN